MAPDNAAVAAAKRVVKKTKVVELKVVEVSLPGSPVEDPGLAQSKFMEEMDQVTEEQSCITRTVPIEDLEAQKQAQEVKKMGQSQGQGEQEAQNEAPKEPYLDKIAGPPRDESKKRVREDEEAQDRTQEKIPTPPREEGSAQPMKCPQKAQDKGGEGGERKKRKRRNKVEEEPGRQDYRRYIRRVLKTIEPEIGISSGAVTVVNNFLNDVFEKLAEEATKLSVQTRKKTITSKDIQGAVRLVLPRELAKHALAQGNKAWANYLRFNKK